MGLCGVKNRPGDVDLGLLDRPNGPILILVRRTQGPDLRTGENLMKIVAKGNTYPARTQLRDAGFDWDKALKVWTIGADDFDRDEWERVNNNPTYSRANQKACSGVVFEELKA